MEDLLALQTQRAQERQRAISEGIEAFVQLGEAKAEIVIKAVTEPRVRLDAKA